MYNEQIPLIAGADFSNGDAQYKAVAIGGTIAATNGASIGILYNKPKSGEDASVGYQGRLKYKAGLAVTAGNRIKVTTSGWFIPVTSDAFGVGTALASVASGAVGEAIFNFAGARTAVESANFA